LNRQILVGDVLEQLIRIPEKSIDCVITSPPYWGLRDYGVEGQWGLEPDFHDYLKSMQLLMEALSRVLKDTGTVWINLGDTYGFNQGKSRHGIPERFYINCIDSGWIARNHIPWYKSNSMPSSIKDRFTNKWESIFFFAKQQRYYFNLDAVREKVWTETKPFNIRVRENITGHAQAKLGDRSWTASDEELATHNEKGEKYDIEPDSNVSRLHRDRKNSPHKQDNTLGADGKPKANYKGFNDRWAERKYSEQTIQREHFGEYDKEGNLINNPNGKNPGDVFFINPQPFPEAHFATFPVELPLKILKCACPPDGIVLDPFFGAGTVGVAAEKLGMDWIGIELKQEYTDIARKRLEPFLNMKLVP